MEKCTPCLPVAFYQNAALLFGLACPGEDGHYHGEDETATGFHFRQSRFVLVGEESVATDTPHQYLQGFRQKTELRAGAFQSTDFSPMGGLTWSFADLAHLLGLDDDLSRFALYLFISRHPVQFHHKNGLIRLHTPSEQQALLVAEEQLQARKQFLKQIEDFLAGGELQDETSDKLYAELPFLGQSGESRDLYRLITHTWNQLEPAEAVLQFRKLCSELPDTLDPLVAASGIPVGFAPGLFSEPMQVSQSRYNGRQVFTIDDEETRDYDDAISFEHTSEGYRLGVHVADVTALLPWGGKLCQEAGKRVSSFYAVQDTVPMFPPRYSEGEFSLIKGERKAVLSIYLELDAEGTPLKTHISREQVEVTENYTYKQIDAQLGQEPFTLLWRFAQDLKSRRDVQETGERQRYHYYFRSMQGTLQLKRIDHESPARIMVEEFMILFNSGLADYALRMKVPVLFRNVSQNGGTGDRNLPSQAYLSTTPDFHPGIGTAAYLHATSPIRRFTDLINHYQITAALENQTPPLATDALDKLVEPIAQRLNLLKELSHHNDRWWCLKYIEERFLYVPMDVFLRGMGKGVLRLEILPWGKQVMAKSSSYPREDLFKVVFTAIDWEKLTAEVDIL